MTPKIKKILKISGIVVGSLALAAGIAAAIYWLRPYEELDTRYKGVTKIKAKDFENLPVLTLSGEDVDTGKSEQAIREQEGLPIEDTENSEEETLDAISSEAIPQENDTDN